MKTLSKIYLFLGVLAVDLSFFVLIRQSLPEGYEWIISTISYYVHIPLEVTTSLSVTGGFVTAIICVFVTLYFVYGAVRKSAWREC